MKVLALALAALITVVVGMAALTAGLLGGSGPVTPSSGASHVAVADIPPAMLALYARAAAHAHTTLRCPGIDWALLAAVGKIETNHGRSPLPGVTSGENEGGAGGPMQFLQPTFDAVTAEHPPPPGGAAPPSRYNPHDAVHTAAAYLCDSGLRTGDLHDAVYAYNHSATYVTTVLDQAAAYRGPPTSPGDPPDQAGGRTPAGTESGPGAVALAYAVNQLGLPYQWGGNGPGKGNTGFDCSGLTTAAWAAAGIQLPRTAHTQYLAGPLLPPGTPLQAGDLLFFGTPLRVRHVALATGQGTLVIHAPRANTLIRIQDARELSGYLAASRPAPGPT